MGQQLTIELDDRTVENLRQQADEAGLSLTALIAALCQRANSTATDTLAEAKKEENKHKPEQTNADIYRLSALSLTEAQRKEALEDLMSIVGSMDLGYATGIGEMSSSEPKSKNETIEASFCVK